MFQFHFIFFLYSFTFMRSDKLVSTNKFLLCIIKSISPIEKCLYLMESYVLQISLMIFLLPVNFLISYGMHSIPKLSKYFTLSPFTYAVIHEFQLICIHQYLLHTTDPLFQVNYFLNRHH